MFVVTEWMSTAEFYEVRGQYFGKTIKYMETNTEDYEQVWPGWATEIALMLKFWEKTNEKSWTIKGSKERMLGMKELGIEVDKEGVVDVKGSCKLLDLSSVL